jgi:NADH-quinone oxidoreductase subunit N
MLAGVVVATKLGVRATVFYLAAYLLMNLAAFAVIIARERETGLGDDISAVAGLGARRPLLAWPLTISMLALAGVPATAGFIGKFQLIRACVDGSYAWLGIVIVIGSMISLAYYLRVVLAIWVRDAPDTSPLPALAGGSPEADVIEPPSGPAWEVTLVAVVFGAATIAFGVIPQPLFDFAARAGASFSHLL